MTAVFEDGLHPVSHSWLKDQAYSDLPQVYEPSEKVKQPAPQAYTVNRSPESAPIHVEENLNLLKRDENGNFWKATTARLGELSGGTSKRKMRVTIAFAVLVFVLVIALAVGLGIGLSRSKASGNPK